MGGEVLILAGSGLGACVLAFLAYRVANTKARPYVLPTLISATAVGLYGAVTDTTGNAFWFFFFWFLLGAVTFGAHAHAIRWLRERRT